MWGIGKKKYVARINITVRINNDFVPKNVEVKRKVAEVGLH